MVVLGDRIAILRCGECRLSFRLRCGVTVAAASSVQRTLVGHVVQRLLPSLPCRLPGIRYALCAQQNNNYSHDFFYSCYAGADRCERTKTTSDSM